MTNMINSIAAVEAAMASVALKIEDTVKVEVKFNDGLYELDVLTSFQRYDFYVDAMTGEVLGINAEPCDEASSISIEAPVAA